MSQGILSTGNSWRAAVALAALCLMQLSWAGHESHHTLGDIDETCAVCAHFDDAKPVAAAQTSAAAPIENGNTDVTPDASFVERLRGHRYAARAPPQH